MILAIASLFVATGKTSYRFEGSFIECCSCKGVCTTEITGQDAGCHGFGAIHFDRGSFGGRSIAGGSAAFAFDSGKWVRLYIDGPKANRTAIQQMMTLILKDWGKLDAVQPASVRISHLNGHYRLIVDNGKIARLDVKPVMGGDGRSPVTHRNLTSPMHSILMQGSTVHASFSEGRPFTLRDTNGFFNLRCTMHGWL